MAARGDTATHTANEKCLMVALARSLMDSARMKKRGKRAQHRKFLVIAMTEAGKPWNTGCCGRIPS